MDQIWSELAKHGIFALLMGVMGWAYWQKSKEVKEAESKTREANEKRTADAQAVVDKLLSLNDKWNATLNNVANTMEAQKDATVDNTEAIRSFGQDLRESIRELRQLGGPRR
jgi:small-conductance mechanosensitive channel